ncbi:MAG: cytochrome c [Hyphomicrobiaceae bacterium]
MRGSAIAAEKCVKCHAVGYADSSPHKITPPLRDLVKWYPVPMIVEGLKTGSLAGHDEMPQFDLGVDGVAALVAYIDSLNPKGPHYLKGRK